MEPWHGVACLAQRTGSGSPAPSRCRIVWRGTTLDLVRVCVINGMSSPYFRSLRGQARQHTHLGWEEDVLCARVVQQRPLQLLRRGSSVRCFSLHRYHRGPPRPATHTVLRCHVWGHGGERQLLLQLMLLLLQQLLVPQGPRPGGRGARDALWRGSKGRGPRGRLAASRIGHSGLQHLPRVRVPCWGVG